MKNGLDHEHRPTGVEWKAATGIKMSCRAFTLIELLVVIAIIGILAATLLPVLHQAQLRGQTAACIDDQKQLSSAWLMYANDNNDACVGNNWPNEQVWAPHNHWYQNWLSGWLGADGTGGNGVTGGVGGPDNTNTDILINPRYATLGDYTKVPKLYLCPASVVVAPVSGANPPYYPLVRTVSMNCWVGYNCLPPGANNGQYASGSAILPDYSSLTYQTFSRTTEMRGAADPSDLFVFMEERPESIDDGSFETAETGPGLPNIPTDYHNDAATVGFADGHVEVHRWRTAPCLTPQVSIVKQKLTGSGYSVGTDNVDWQWLSQHASAPK